MEVFENFENMLLMAILIILTVHEMCKILQNTKPRHILQTVILNPLSSVLFTLLLTYM